MNKVTKSTKYFFHAIEYVRRLNTPLRFFNRDWFVNERIVEIPFVHQYFDINKLPKMNILELGCTRSALSLELSSMGAQVTGVDLRPYFIDHQNFTFHQENLLNLKFENKFDAVVSVSTVEHIGLGAYGEAENFEDLHAVTDKLTELLKPGGHALVTVPFGIKSQDDFLRSFSYDQIKKLFRAKSMTLTDEYYYCRETKEFKYWKPCTRKEIEKISNVVADRGPTGVNGVGCFVWTKAN